MGQTVKQLPFQRLDTVSNGHETLSSEQLKQCHPKIKPCHAVPNCVVTPASDTAVLVRSASGPPRACPPQAPRQAALRWARRPSARRTAPAARFGVELVCRDLRVGVSYIPAQCCPGCRSLRHETHHLILNNYVCLFYVSTSGARVRRRGHGSGR